MLSTCIGRADAHPALPSTDRSIVWLAGLIEATEVVAATTKPCDPATVKAFGDRLALRADVRPLCEPVSVVTAVKPRQWSRQPCDPRVVCVNSRRLTFC